MTEITEAEVLRGATARYHQDATFHALVDTAVSVVEACIAPYRLSGAEWLATQQGAAVALVLDDHRRREQAERLSTRHPLEQAYPDLTKDQAFALRYGHGSNPFGTGSAR